jgi:20S proteasome alpha/beta subunit
MESHKENEINGPHSMGTTIIGVTYNGGVVLGADSRTSTGKSHNFLLLQKNLKEKDQNFMTPVFVVGFCRSLCCKSSIR